MTEPTESESCCMIMILFQQFYQQLEILVHLVSLYLNNKDLPSPGQYHHNQRKDSAVSLSLRSLAKPVSFISIFLSLNYFVLHFSPAFSWCVWNYLCTLMELISQVFFFLQLALWTCIFITIMSCGPALIKTSSHPATFLFPLFSTVVFSCCVAQPMTVQMGELEMTWHGSSQLIDCRTSALRVLIFNL